MNQQLCCTSAHNWQMFNATVDTSSYMHGCFVTLSLLVNMVSFMFVTISIDLRGVPVLLIFYRIYTMLHRLTIFLPQIMAKYVVNHLNKCHNVLGCGQCSNIAPICRCWLSWLILFQHITWNNIVPVSHSKEANSLKQIYCSKIFLTVSTLPFIA